MKLISKSICLAIAAVFVFSAMLSSCEKTEVAPQVEGKQTSLNIEADAKPGETNNVLPEAGEDHDEGYYYNVMQMVWPDRSLDEIVGDADYIIRAKNVGHEPSYRNDKGTDRHVYTDYVFEVLESFKGDRAEGDTIAVKWYGGEIDGVKSIVADETEIKEGEEYILILSHETDENDVPTENDKYMYYPPRGILADDGNGVFTANDPAVSFTADEFRAEVENILG